VRNYGACRESAETVMRLAFQACLRGPMCAQLTLSAFEGVQRQLRTVFAYGVKSIGKPGPAERLGLYAGSYCIVAGVHVAVEGASGVGGGVVLWVGGVDQGTFTKSKKSSRLGWAASRLVRYCWLLMKRSSTNLMIAV
jgi:hypothetical protein